jgi:hypothetical protein
MRLGGLLDAPVWRPGGWDIVFAERLAVELDEELHFNRYRATTLGASWAANLPWTGLYKRYCAQYERRCFEDGRRGGRWSNASSSRMFAGGPVGQLDGEGAPRWKQRAFYDALKDAGTRRELGFSIARVAIYDTVDGVVLDDILEHGASVEPRAVRALVEKRTVRSSKKRS